tara:strand:- start:54 stop:284 length:231 start_codon:yes stop_codon:yes gene_type:complete
MNAEMDATISDRLIALRTESSVRIEKKDAHGVRCVKPINGNKISKVAKLPNIAMGMGVERALLAFMTCSESILRED